VVDKVYSKLEKANHDVGEPKFRVPVMGLASLLVPMGLLWYGWSAEMWIMPNIGAFIFSSGVIMTMQCVNNYIVDAYPLYAASAIAAVRYKRSVPLPIPVTSLFYSRSIPKI
jgi:hypothetical protein